MPTKPNDSFIDRDRSKEEAKKIIDLAAPVLQEMVNYGSQLVSSCIPEKKVKYAHLSILLAYMHVLEMLDAVEVLISNACFGSAIPTVRSAFEGLLSLEYLTSNDTERRSRCYEFFHFRSELKECSKLDPKTEEGKKLLKAYQNDKFLRNRSIALPENLQTRLPDLIASYEGKMNDSRFVDIRAELNRTIKNKKKNKKYPYWFTLFDGPGSIKELADHLNRSGQFENYGEWSGVSHAAPAHSRFTVMGKDDIYIKPFRCCDWTSALQMSTAIMNIAAIALSATEIFTKALRPDEIANFENWRTKEIKPNLVKLIRMENNPLEPIIASEQKP